MLDFLPSFRPRSQQACDDHARAGMTVCDVRLPPRQRDISASSSFTLQHESNADAGEANPCDETRVWLPMGTRGRRDLHPRAPGLHGGREPGDDESNQPSANFGSLMNGCRPGGDPLTSQVSAIRVVPQLIALVAGPVELDQPCGLRCVGGCAP